MRDLPQVTHHKKAKGKTPIELFRADWLKEQRALDRNINPVSTEAWADVRLAFEGLAHDRKQAWV